MQSRRERKKISFRRPGNYTSADREDDDLRRQQNEQKRSKKSRIDY